MVPQYETYNSVVIDGKCDGHRECSPTQPALNIPAAADCCKMLDRATGCSHCCKNNRVKLLQKHVQV